MSGLLYRRCFDWGATVGEVQRAMAGDDMLARPDVVTTRAVTVAAPPAAIWPWLVQMGPGRAGAYTYDWIENLFGLNMHSADRILPQFQDLQVGDILSLASKGPRMRVVVLEPRCALAFCSEDRSWVWSFGLYPYHGGTRLVSRNRIVVRGTSPLRLVILRSVMVPASLVMERRMLLGIKSRAEQLAIAGEAGSAVMCHEPAPGTNTEVHER